MNTQPSSTTRTPQRVSVHTEAGWHHRDHPTLGAGRLSYGDATATNDSGTIVLEDEIPSPGEWNYLQDQAFVVDQFGAKLIPTPSQFAGAAGVNLHGVVVGSYVLVETNAAGTDEVWSQHGFSTSVTNSPPWIYPNHLIGR